MSNSLNTKTIADAMISAQGIKGLKNQAITYTVNHCLDRMKKHFGISMEFDSKQSQIVIEWIKKYDDNFKNHIANPYIDISGNKLKKENPVINGDFVVKLEKATYLFVTGMYTQDIDNSIRSQILSIYFFGKKSMKWFCKLTKYIENKRLKTQRLYSITAKSDGDSNWWSCTSSTLIPREINSLFFDQDIITRVTSHLDSWIKNMDIFNERGLIFKTGILLYGNAGTGKSSLANAIANYLNCSMITIDTSTFHNLNISEVIDAISADETMYVVLIDEIDTIFTSRDNENQTDKQKENTAKLLSLLDSPQSPTNVVFVATTNYIDRLDKALMRRGRFDLILELSDITKATAFNMCESFDLYSDEIHELFYKNNVKFPVNPAYLQSLILEYISDRNKEKVDE